MTEKKRDEAIDSLKGFLIICVIIGHIIEKKLTTSASLSRGLYNFIYLFHMPAFICISGMFSQNLNLDKQNFKKILTIFETFIVFDFLHRLTFLFSNNFSSEILFSNLLIPTWTMWFLLSLCFFKSFFLLLNKMIRNPIQILLLAFCLGLLAGFIPIEKELSFQRTLYFFPFFVLGYIIKNKDIIQTLHQAIFKKISSIGLCVAIISCIFCFNFDFNQYLWGAFSYKNNTDILYRTICYVMSSTSIFLLLGFFNRKKSFLVYFGRNTLFFYIYHSFLIVFLAKLTNIFFQNNKFLEILLTTIISITILILMKKIKFFGFLLNPYSKICGAAKKKITTNNSNK